MSTERDEDGLLTSRPYEEVPRGAALHVLQLEDLERALNQLATHHLCAFMRDIVDGDGLVTQGHLTVMMARVMAVMREHMSQGEFFEEVGRGCEYAHMEAAAMAKVRNKGAVQ